MTTGPEVGEGRRRVAEPGMGDEPLRAATGRGWDEWAHVLDAWPATDRDHAAIVAHLQQEHGLEGWWAQTVTVGYERMTGRRLPYQRPDGTFSAGRSRTVAVDPAALRERLLTPEGRRELLPGHETELRSRPTSKNVRLALGPGVAEIAIDPLADGRAKVTIDHARLPAFEDVEAWKAFWGVWLEDLDGG